MAAGVNVALYSRNSQVNLIPAGAEAEKQLHAVFQWQSTVKAHKQIPDSQD